MSDAQKHLEYEVIVIGSGTGGATVARELAKQGKRVLILERGGNAPLQESLSSYAAIADQVTLGEKLTTLRALTTGGSTGLYFGVVYDPNFETFRGLGIDLAPHAADVRKELPVAPLPDELIGEQSKRLHQSASARGYYWYRHDMLIDQRKCSSGYSNDARWRARSHVDEAVQLGATLINRATVRRVLVENDRAIGVEYKLKTGLCRSEIRRAYGSKIVVAAGELATPQILRDSGLNEIGRRGFYCNPGDVLFGMVPGLQGQNSFVGSMGGVDVDGIELGDANLSQFLHRQMMLAKLKFKHAFSYPQTIGMSVKVKDSRGGELTDSGRFHKEFTVDDHARLKKGAAEARKVLEDAGAKNIFNVGLVCAGRVGGLVDMGEHLDAKLETRIRDLHVCDGSVIPDDMRGPPTMTLLCLGKYLASQLAAPRYS